jgi:CRP-like cAMP-binding protein
MALKSGAVIMVRENTLFKMFGKFCPQGTIIFNEDELGEETYYIQSGSVRLRGSGTGEKGVLGPGDLLGEESLLGPASRSVMAEALEDSRLVVIDAHNMENVVRNGPELAVSVMRDLMKVLDEDWRKFREWRERFFAGKLDAFLRRSGEGKSWTLTEVSAQTEIEEEGVRRIFEGLVSAGALQRDGERYNILDPGGLEGLVKEEE